MEQLSLDLLKQDKELKKLVDKYNISDKVLSENMIVLSRFKRDFVLCEPNQPLSMCKQSIPGVQQKLSFLNNTFYVTSKNCQHWVFENKDYKLQKNILYADYDFKEVPETIEEFLNSDKAKNLDGNLEKLLIGLNKTKTEKGFYVYGEPGIGKTYIMKLLANTYAKLDKKVILVTVNKLIKKVKETFKSLESNDYNKFFDQCCDVDVLILDDIGSEIVSDWSRDELLFGLLNTRMENKKLTFFTSNFSIPELETHYLNKKIRDQSLMKFEKMKTLRFTERIKGLSFCVRLHGSNKRY
ncbi:DnaA ATPase domain-containing protein [Spiroplasma apis]|uniref:Primosomal protein DnaI n=1 Tax=Spiroplasma apis B31 TaxID=1276258 RepID=V5RJP3_SPIAP|nr:DnaA/Hda family protein [Spiroplasma apis]AHB36698.1 primosomal protein DnaI [Spiroplasma apis B31]